MNIVRGALVFFSERYGGKPFNNCLLIALLMVLRWMGYDVQPDYDDELRVLTGKPDYDKNGKPLGLNFGDAMRALLRSGLAVLPTLERLTDDEFLAGLKRFGGRGRHKAVYAVIVDTTNLPPHFQRLVGQGYDDLHGIAISAVSDLAGVLTVWMLDPMGRTAPGPHDDPATFDPYIGEPIAWAVLSPCLKRSPAGKIIGIRGFKNTAQAVAQEPAPVG